MMRILRADERYRSDQDGIASSHCFSAGGHYDADNLSFGALLGCDEHVVAPGVGFGWHGHRGVDIVSWVLSGTLRHEDGAGRVCLMQPGQVLLQSTGTGIRHCEVNASVRDPLRMVQMTLVGGGAEPFERVATPPLDVGSARFAVWNAAGALESERWHLFVASGSWRLDDALLGPGDSGRGVGPLAVVGAGELLVWEL